MTISLYKERSLYSVTIDFYDYKGVTYSQRTTTDVLKNNGIKNCLAKGDLITGKVEYRESNCLQLTVILLY